MNFRSLKQNDKNLVNKDKIPVKQKKSIFKCPIFYGDWNNFVTK